MTIEAEPTIDVRGVSKWFGSVVAVNNLSVQVGPGITGLLGPNGAGKTTLLHMITGLAKPSEGEIRVLGEPVRHNPKLYRRIGVMSEHEATYGLFTGQEFVEYMGRLYDL
ncbi:MAG: ATP-binding cassette domain-containing protein, partial [Chloroflexi bacterium]|nr:ATP-binding cassette domain-containing protein [Chloroflexota bacterium]